MKMQKLVISTVMALVATCAHATPESLDRIREAVRTSLGVAEGSYQIYGLESALSVPRCSEPLRGWARNVTGTSATVDVACQGSPQWKIYVPVRLHVAVDVIAARVALPRGTRIGEGDIAVVRRPSNGLPANFLSRPKDVVGKELRRSIQAGQIVVAGALDSPLLVARGQTVTLVSQLPGIMVKSTGVAVEDGRLGQRVRIRARSREIIEGRVLAADTVGVGKQ